jgi:hypothetical protein
VDGGVDAHRELDGVLAHELLVDLEHAFELVVDLLARVRSALALVELGDVEVDLLPALDAPAHAADAVDDEADEVSAEQVAVDGVHLFAHVPALVFRDVRGDSGVHRVSGDPDSSALASHGLGDEPALVFARNCGRVDLDHLGIAVVDALLVADRDGGAGVDDRVRALAEDHAVASGRDNYGVGGEGLDLHRAQVLGGDAAAHAVLVLDDAEELPAFVLLDQVPDFPAPDLLVQGVQELLAGGRSGVGGAVLEGSAESAEAKEPFAGPVERHAHAVEEIDDRGGSLGHAHDRRLVVQEVASRDGVFEVEVGRIALAAQVHRAVDSALGADGV